MAAKKRQSGQSKSHAQHLASGERQERLYLEAADQAILDFLAALDGSRAEAIRISLRERYARLRRK